MTCKEKKQWLQRYKKLDGAIDQKIGEAEALRSICEKMTTNFSDIPKAPGVSTKEDAYIRLVTLSNEINGEIDQYVDMRGDIEAAINTVQDVTLQTLLRLRYISGETWEKIAVEMGYDYRWVLRLHGKALSVIEIRH